MISHFKDRFRSFVWYLIVSFTIRSVPHFELVPLELAGFLIGEAHAAQMMVVSSFPKNLAQLSFETSYTYDYSGKVVELT
ncbi:MAG: hypothetical protein ABSB79_02330 [Syntrophales bacterium]